jgi:hypothetical protein
MKRKIKKNLILPLAQVYRLTRINFEDLNPGDIAIIPENDPKPFIVKTRPYPSGVPGIKQVQVADLKF